MSKSVETVTLGATELKQRLAEGTETPRTRVHLILDALALIAAAELSRGHRVRIPGIGILEARETKARDGTGPGGLPYSVPASHRVRLRPDKALTRAARGELMGGFMPDPSEAAG